MTLRHLEIFSAVCAQESFTRAAEQLNMAQPVLNVYENIVLPIQLDGNAPDKAYVERIIETLGLEAKLQNLPAV